MQRDSKEFSLSIGWRIGGLSRAKLLVSIQDKEFTYERQICRFWISNLHFNIPKRYTVDKSSLILSKRSINSLNPVHGWTRSRKEILKGPILVSVHALPRKKVSILLPYHITRERKRFIFPLNVNEPVLNPLEFVTSRPFPFHPPTEKASNLPSGIMRFAAFVATPSRMAMLPLPSSSSFPP